MSSKWTEWNGHRWKDINELIWTELNQSHQCAGKWRDAKGKDMKEMLDDCGSKFWNMDIRTNREVHELDCALFLQAKRNWNDLFKSLSWQCMDTARMNHWHHSGQPSRRRRTCRRHPSQECLTPRRSLCLSSNARQLSETQQFHRLQQCQSHPAALPLDHRFALL